jgi:hypothetical protein
MSQYKNFKEYMVAFVKLFYQTLYWRYHIHPAPSQTWLVIHLRSQIVVESWLSILEVSRLDKDYTLLITMNLPQF